ncbi:MAG TPA: PEP-CTERM sorting domain-containing protein, partial [Stellaceae bacterium]|nr:PEP-CTERM sorting domain-containing protein [Stellaceae bacterium]
TAPTGGTIQLAGLQATMTSSDPGDTLGFSTSWSSASSYNQYTIGLIFNGSGTHVVDTGPATQAVDELIVVGLGNAIPAAASNPTCAGAGSDQAQLDCVAGQYDALIPFNVTTTFTLGGQTASDTVDFVPEPGTLTLFGSAVAGLGVLRRRRKRG